MLGRFLQLLPLLLTVDVLASCPQFAQIRDMSGQRNAQAEFLLLSCLGYDKVSLICRTVMTTRLPQYRIISRGLGIRYLVLNRGRFVVSTASISTASSICRGRSENARNCSSQRSFVEICSFGRSPNILRYVLSNVSGNESNAFWTAR